MSSPTTETSEPPQLADSPWFWLCVFGCMALLGVSVIGPKYAKRRGQLDQRFDVRQEIDERRAGSAAESESEVAARAEYEQGASDRLRPLTLFLAAVLAGVACWLYVRHTRDRVRRMVGGPPESHPRDS